MPSSHSTASRPSYAAAVALLSGLTVACAASPGRQTLEISPVPAATSAPHAAAEVLPFIRNDYAKAMQEASARGVPVFVETWAGW